MLPKEKAKADKKLKHREDKEAKAHDEAVAAIAREEAIKDKLLTDNLSKLA